MHISDKILAELLRTGWRHKAKDTFTKRIEGYAEAGTVSNGARIVTLEMDATGRWLSRVDGWGKVEKDADLRNYQNDPRGAIDAVLAD